MLLGWFFIAGYSALFGLSSVSSGCGQSLGSTPPSSQRQFSPACPAMSMERILASPEASGLLGSVHMSAILASFEFFFWSFWVVGLGLAALLPDLLDI